jgi:hypothetical protein
VSSALRNGISVLLLVVAATGAYVDYRAYQAGVPGQHRLVITAYLVVAIYALASLILRARTRGR